MFDCSNVIECNVNYLQNCRQDKDKGVDMTQHEISSAEVHPHPQHVSQGIC
jgi:hypothetical protein